MCESTVGVVDSWNNPNFFWKYIMFKGLLHRTYTDPVSQEDCVRKSDPGWIIDRPAAFTNDNRTGQYSHCFADTDKTTKLKISRADAADFKLKQLTDDTYLHKTPALAY